MTVDLFITCLNDALFPRTGIALVRLFERLGHKVRFNKGQTCCGQMHSNSGYPDEALPLIRRFVEVFEKSDLVVAPSASCVAMVRELYPTAAEQAGDAALATRARDLGSRVFEFSEFLVGPLGVEDVGATFRHKVAYHPTCHSLRALKVGDAPTRLLARVAGLEILDLPSADQCCGFGGTFSVKNAETSTAMMDDKIACLEASGAEVLCALDNSCLMHIGGGLSRRGSLLRVMHLAEILASTDEYPA
jgi:L-lactate dehydrogenase complex protein LldE